MKKIIATGVVAIALVLGSALSANAATTDFATSIRSTETNSACVAAIADGQARGVKGLSSDVCTATVITTAGPATPATTFDVKAAQSSLSASDFKALVVAAAAGTVHSKPYSQTINQITDSETQSGTFYYDGARAWVTVTYRGYNGTHSCKVNYAVGYAITNTACSDSGSTTSRKLQMNWNVSIAVKGGPIAWAESYTMHVNSAGTISNG